MVTKAQHAQRPWAKVTGLPVTGCSHDETCRNLRCIEQRDQLIANLLATLTAIAKGEGPYNRDQLIHAGNTIEAMKQLATDAIAKAHRTA